MDRYVHKNLYDAISFSWRIQADKKRRYIRDRLNVPSTIEYLTPIHRVQLRKPCKRLAGSHVVIDGVISPSKEPPSKNPSSVTTRSVLKPKSSTKELKCSRSRQLQDDTKSKKGNKTPKKEEIFDSLFLDEHRQQKQTQLTPKSQTNYKTLTAEQKKIRTKEDNPSLDLLYDKKRRTTNKKGGKIQAHDGLDEYRILDEYPHKQYPQELEDISVKQNQSEKQKSEKKAKKSQTYEDDDRDYLFKTLNENNFNVVRVSGAQQNCLYRCVVLGTNNDMLQEYKKESKSSSSYNSDKLDKAASDLRQNVCKFGRQELHTFTQLTSDYGLREIMRERKCNNFLQVLDQISKPHVPADIFDQLLLSNYLKIKLVIFRFDRKNNNFHFLISSHPEEKYLNASGNHTPIVYVRHNHSPEKANEEGDHYDLLLLKQ